MSIEFDTYSDVCDVYYSLIFITVFLSSVVLPMYFFFTEGKNNYVLKVCLTDIKRVCDIYFFI